MKTWSLIASVVFFLGACSAGARKPANETAPAVFRVVPNFMAQFGIAADPAVTKAWDVPIQDDPSKPPMRGAL